MKTTKTLYAWHWMNGGYNSCMATSREDAIAQGNALGAPRAFSGGVTNTLTVNPATIRVGAAAEKFVAEQDRFYAGMFN